MELTLVKMYSFVLAHVSTKSMASVGTTTPPKTQGQFKPNFTGMLHVF